MDWRILVLYPELEANTAVYFDWKTVIYIYACEKCRTQFMLPNSSTCTFTTERSVIFTSACANEIIQSINRLFVYKAKVGCHVRISHHQLLVKNVVICINNNIFCFSWHKYINKTFVFYREGIQKFNEQHKDKVSSL